VEVGYRATKKICGWTLGDRGTETARHLAAQLPHTAHIPFCTDFWHSYGLISAPHRHLQGTRLHHRKP
jgi:IS1 family transposase